MLGDEGVPRQSVSPPNRLLDKMTGKMLFGRTGASGDSEIGSGFLCACQRVSVYPYLDEAELFNFPNGTRTDGVTLQALVR